MWRFSHKCRSIPGGKVLRVEVRSPAAIRWSPDNWKTIADLDTRDSGIGLHIVDMPTASLAAGSVVRFTFLWKDAGHWEGTDFAVEIEKQNSL